MQEGIILEGTLYEKYNLMKIIKRNAGHSSARRTVGRAFTAGAHEEAPCLSHTLESLVHLLGLLNISLLFFFF